MNSSFFQFINGVLGSRINLDKVVVSGAEVSYEFSCSLSISSYFLSKKMKIDFGEDVTDVPEEILVIPFVANLLPFVWLSNSVLHLSAIDEEFERTIPVLREAYRKMYPMLHFAGEVLCDKKINLNGCVSSSSKSAFFFSGGVDSFFTLVKHKQENLLAISLCGADFLKDDVTSYSKMNERMKYVSDVMGVTKGLMIRSDFREFLNNKKLNKLVRPSKRGWWYGFQHGMGIISHAAPSAYKHGYKRLYIASSNSVGSTDMCASDPTIDEQVKFCGISVIHDGYSYTRMEKVEELVSLCKENDMRIPLHVCWEVQDGENCSVCEKCVRTIFEIYSAGGDPEEFGFCPSKMDSEKVLSYMKNIERRDEFYVDIINKMRERYSYDEVVEWAKVLYNYNF